MSASDIESLQPRASSGRRCLHAFLITSVITQFVLLFGVTVIAALFIRQIQTELATLTKPTHKSPEAILDPRMGNSGYKVQNFAYLRPESGSLKNDTVKWMAESPESVGSGYKFSDTLQPNKEGSYLIYLDLVLRCVRNDARLCSSTNITVRVGGRRSEQDPAGVPGDFAGAGRGGKVLAGGAAGATPRPSGQDGGAQRRQELGAGHGAERDGDVPGGLAEAVKCGRTDGQTDRLTPPAGWSGVGGGAQRAAE
ncbi:hypothetical protein SKAU_G00295400 [Synaphobranchus kaupii]|uniref:Uncharacterized protein n=1 Tax=Synaphobranchus kaupii TaxID=118154 RepID=A0A9Q1EUK5_SYNKA|nr:hypothetical protein SKAU_G00295400 [Synaphobranchus kaupii]